MPRLYCQHNLAGQLLVRVSHSSHDYITCVERMTNDCLYKLGSFVVFNSFMLAFDDGDNTYYTITGFRFGIFDLGPDIC
jgi:hypothetical protein